jgi:hypothetical protein
LPQQLKDIWQDAPIGRRFVYDCYALAPQALLLWVFIRMLVSCSGAASLFISSLLLDLVEGVIESKNPNSRRLITVGAARILFSLAQWASHEVL